MRAIITMTICIGLASSAYGQWIGDVSVGGTGYTGDLTGRPFNSISYSFGIDAGYQLNEMLAVYSSTTYYQVSGLDEAATR